MNQNSNIAIKAINHSFLFLLAFRVGLFILLILVLLFFAFVQLVQAQEKTETLTHYYSQLLENLRALLKLFGIIH